MKNQEPTEAEVMLMEDYGMTIKEARQCFIPEAMERYARNKNQELQLLVNILTPTSKKTLKCDCEEPIPNYPEMVWCEKCGFKIDNTKYCACGEEIESENSAVCLDCFNEMTYPD